MALLKKFLGLATLAAVVATWGCAVAPVVSGGLLLEKVTADKRPLSTQLSDAGIKSRIVKNLMDDTDINPLSLDILVHQGHVTVAGVVSSEADIRMVYQAVTRAEGVRSITVNLVLPEN